MTEFYERPSIGLRTLDGREFTRVNDELVQSGVYSREIIRSLINSDITLADCGTGLSAAYGCKRIIAETIAAMPLRVMDRLGRDVSAQYLWTRKPSSSTTPYAFLHELVESLVIEGTAVVEVSGSNNKALSVLPYRSVSMSAEDGWRVWASTKTGSKLLDSDRTIVVARNPSAGSRVGRAPSDELADVFERAIGVEHFSSDYFRNSANPSLAITLPEKISKDSQRDLKASIKKRAGGRNNHSPLVLPPGAKLETMSFNAEQSQLLSTREFTGIDIATRVFGVPAALLGYKTTSAWGSGGLKEANTWLYTYCLRAYIVAIEQSLDRLVDRGHAVRIDPSEYLSPSDGELIDYLGSAVASGIMTVDEARARIGLDPLDGPISDVEAP